MTAPAALHEAPAGAGGFGLARVHEAFPWAPEHLRLGRPLEWIWSHPVRAAAADIWPLIADTSRLNRTIGLPRMSYEERDGVLHGSTKYWGVPMRWVEPPWSWEVNRNLFCTREYSRGFARVFRAGCFLEPQSDGRTMVRMYFAWIPRGFLWRIFLGRMFPKMERVYLRALEKLDRHLSDPARPGFHRVPRADLGEEARALLTKGRESLLRSGVEKTLADQWIGFLSSGDPMDLHRIHLRIIAHQWRFPQRRVLESALAAVEAGLLDLHWDIVCPHCRGPRASLRSLEQLPPGMRCEACRTDFLTEGRGHVDATFRPNPLLRKTEQVFYCAAEPARKEHYLAQRRVPAGERAALSADWPEGRYLLSVNGADAGTLLVTGTAVRSGAMEAWPSSARKRELTLPSGGTLELHNDLHEPAVFTVRQPDLPDDMIQLGDFLTIPAFGRLFGSQTLPMNAPLDLGDQALVFAAEGDSGEPSAAFVDLVGRTASAHEGVVVRTSGHSVLILFNEAAAGVRAAHDLLAGSGPGARASVHTGACKVVRGAAGRDLIGATVNIASRLLSAAVPGEALLSAAAASDPAAAEWIASRGLEPKLRQLNFDDLGVVEQARRLKPAARAGDPPA